MAGRHANWRRTAAFQPVCATWRPACVCTLAALQMPFRMGVALVTLYQLLPFTLLSPGQLLQLARSPSAIYLALWGLPSSVIPGSAALIPIAHCSMLWHAASWLLGLAVYWLLDRHARARARPAVA